ncbi:MAG: hypothetical protein DMG62_00430, partial [Acidobacteria bacterium]
MTSCFPVAKPLRGVFSRTFALSALCFALCTHDLCAQVGNNNPSGVSGIFNGQIADGIDPYTGNVTRTITDISVAGSPSVYALALVRTANSRTPSVTGVFGWEGGWNHNYNWTMEDSPATHTQNFHPVKYTVNFPDGRVETFRAVTWDTVYRVRPGADVPAQSTSAGVSERFLQLNLNNMYAYLILPDGGAVEFRAQQYYDPAYGRYWYKYHLTAIYDPYGLKTTIDSEVVGQAQCRRITKVTEPAGRYLQFYYTNSTSPRIDHVTEYINGIARRSVQYYYTYTWLSSVVYYGNNAWTARYKYTRSNIGGDLPLLLWTCDDPMYPEPMHKIAYTYRTTDNYTGSHPTYGQISSENYYDGTNVGAAVSTLTVPSATTRTETRGDNVTRTFIYNGTGYVTWVPDFTSHSVQQHYDATTKYVDYVVDRKGNRSDYVSDPITGNITQIQFPLTQADTPDQTQRPTVNYTYTNSYYLHTIQDEGHHTTTFTRNGNNRVTRIDYPDGGYETFSYDGSHFYEISGHRMTTGGTETFTYDTRHRLQYYADPYHSSPGNPSITYYYDGLDRVSGIVDALSHGTNFDYNDRAQVTVTTLPWINGVRYTISNIYNSDGTLQNRTDELGHRTSYEYDDYLRLKSVTPPVRGAGDTGTYTTHFYYGANAWDAINDYKLTDSNVTWVVPPSSGLKKIHTVYDDNRRKITVTVAPNTADEATTSYTYDNAGNVTWVTNPLNHNNVHTLYDERNRPYSISVGSHTTTISYDTAGRQKTIQRPNAQTITSDTFDAMNRVTQQTATQTPDPNAVTKYTYFTTADGASAPVGLLKTMKDPRLVQLNNGEVYTYEYDLMGRKKKITYPKDSMNVNRTERWAYDTLGRLETFTNRANKVQTFGYDQLNRMTGSTWNDGGVTPSVSFGYDEASRLVEIDNANASISRTYYNDNLLHMETQSLSAVGGLDNRHVTYTYDEDGNRASLAIPGYTFDYVYTNRNQVKRINDDATGLSQAYYEYDLRGNVILRNVNTSPVTVSSYSYDPYDRPTWITHTLNGTTRSFNYGYYDNSNNREFVRRLGSSLGDIGDVFRYDLSDQAISFQLNVATPQNVDGGSIPQRVFYDSNGNRTSFTSADTYGPANNVNQYTNRTINNHTYNAGYDVTGNLTTSPDATAAGCTYDAQNRLTQAAKSGATMIFKYDGLNRQVSRTVSGVTTHSTWDGWNLVEEYTNNPGLVIQARYLYGPTGLVKELQNNRYYCQDGSGSTSHLLDSNGHLLEWYRYDLHGTPIFYNPNDTQPNPNQSGYGVRHLFTSQQWSQELGLYDLRNRFYSPDLGRFLQPDPISFRGGNNLYRYCRNNPVARWDPLGLQDAVAPTLSEGWTAEVNVTGSEIPLPDLPNIPDLLQRPPDLSGILPSPFGGPVPPSGGGRGGASGSRGGSGQPHASASNNNSPTPQQPPQQNPPTQVPPDALNPSVGVFSHWDAVAPIVAQANMRLDDDGSGPNHNDKHHSRFTSYLWWYGVNLNADTVRYV